MKNSSILEAQVECTKEPLKCDVEKYVEDNQGRGHIDDLDNVADTQVDTTGHQCYHTREQEVLQSNRKG